MKKNSNLKNKAHDKIYSKIQTLVNEIRADQFDIDNGLATKFVPKELHISALNFKKKEKKIYEYILNLINEKRET
jgi:Txe/YoeB family toxin of Txe-Axe toxin-antitoxin module